MDDAAIVKLKVNPQPERAMTSAFLRERPLNGPLAFGEFVPEQAEAALDQVLADNRQVLAALLQRTEPHTWESLIEPLTAMDERIAAVWGPVSHLFGVSSTPQWRSAYNACLPKLTDYGLELSQSEALCAAYRELADSDEFAKLPAPRQKVIQDALRDFRLSGIGLPEERKARYKQLSMRLSEIQTRFEENIMDAAQAWSRHVTDETLLAGMSDESKRQAAAKAAAKGLEGWLLTLDFPSFYAVMTYADARELRYEMYQAYCTRASDQGPLAGQYDNGPLMEEILQIRHEQAHLLGFPNYAALSMATKMADHPDEVERFLLDLAQRARPAAQRELQALQAFALAQGGPATIEPWDSAYYSEKLQQQSLGLSEEDLRPYFALPTVLEGLFQLVRQLYDVTVKPLEGMPVWHPDVRLFAVQRADGTPVGRFYLDPYARDEKRGGAWMDESQNRRRTTQGLQHPVAYLVCNFRPPESGRPALLTHDEVLTLFHEFGHGLHLLMTEVDEPALAGIRGVEWDAVELPSQFMENWAYDSQTLRGFARHWQSGEPIPEPLIQKLRDSRVFQTGLATLRQLEFALFDLRLHRDYAPEKGAQLLETLQGVRDQVAVVQPPAFNRMPWSFSHIFAGGYAAGYYSYKWAEVLSSDAFACFEEAAFDKSVGRRFLDTILARGGSRPAKELFRDFRGRDPSIEALLRHSGLAAPANPR